MNAKLTLSALVLAAFAGNALADDPTVANEQFVSSKTRAEVQAELSAYKQAGVNPWAMSYQPLKYFHSVATREEVRAEYLAARNEVNAFTGEDSGSAYLAQARGTHLPVSTFAGTPSNAQ
jgi:acetyl-CoA acetyltransferase